jgi:multidrug resistance efflux pump
MTAKIDVQINKEDCGRSPLPPAANSDAPPSHLRAVPALITFIAVVLAGIGAWAIWQAYVAAPWTRDGTVRAYVVTITPEVSGRIVQLPVTDNQLVHKGDLLMTIDPTDYTIAVEQA